MWFSVNRLQSSNRIVAYIQLFHEADRKYSWVGWENALRLHRIWLKRCPGGLAEVRGGYSEIKQYDNLSFYKPIFILHIAMVVVVAALMSFVAWVSEPIDTPLGTLPSLLVPSINVLLALGFCLWSTRYRASRLQQGIERNRMIWRAVFEAKEQGDLD